MAWAGAGKSQPHSKQAQQLCPVCPALNVYTLGLQPVYLLRLTSVASFTFSVLNVNTERRPRYTLLIASIAAAWGKRALISFLFPPLHHHHPTSSNDERVLRAYSLPDCGGDERARKGNGAPGAVGPPTPLDKRQSAPGQCFSNCGLFSRT